MFHAEYCHFTRFPLVNNSLRKFSTDNWHSETFPPIISTAGPDHIQWRCSFSETTRSSALHRNRGVSCMHVAHVHVVIQCSDINDDCSNHEVNEQTCKVCRGSFVSSPQNSFTWSQMPVTMCSGVISCRHSAFLPKLQHYVIQQDAACTAEMPTQSNLG